MKTNVQNGISILIVVGIAVVLRLLPHPPNFAPIAALALFGGVYMDKRIAFVLPLLAMFFSDIFLGFSGSTPFVYLSFLLTVGIGLWVKSHKSVGTVFVGAVVSSVIFFLITNFGYWLTFSLYPKTIEGQLQAYTYALPFFRNTLLGDLFYTGLFFGSYEFVKMFFKRQLLVATRQK